MSYAAWSVIAGEQPTAAKWNILGSNDSSFNDGTGIGTNAVQAASLATSAIKLGYSQITTPGTVSSSTFAAFSTSLAVTFTMPAGGRDVKVSVNGSFAGATSSAGFSVGVFESSTLLGEMTWSQNSGGNYIAISFITKVTAPSAGTHTYVLQGAGAAASTLTMQATAGSALAAGPASMLVEAI